MAGDVVLAREVVHSMRSFGQKPSAHSFTALLSATAKASDETDAAVPALKQHSAAVACLLRQLTLEAAEGEAGTEREGAAAPAGQAEAEDDAAASAVGAPSRRTVEGGASQARPQALDVQLPSVAAAATTDEASVRGDAMGVRSAVAAESAADPAADPAGAVNSATAHPAVAGAAVPASSLSAAPASDMDVRSGEAESFPQPFLAETGAPPNPALRSVFAVFSQ